MINDMLFWERFRPKEIKDMVLLPRIETRFTGGIKTNYIFHGYNGMGKTTLTRILLRDKHHIIINSSIKNGIDLLRDELLDFCNKMSSPLVKSDDKKKYIYLEEFDSATTQFQEGLKAFIEDFDDRVRFMITMNNINKVIPPLLSRFTRVNFNPESKEEQRFLKNGYFFYLNNVCKETGINLGKEDIINIINKNFPDLRYSVQCLQDIYITGRVDILQDSLSEQEKVFEFLLNGENDFIKNYDFVNEYINNPDQLLNIMGRPFYSFLMRKHVNIVDTKGVYLINTSREYNQNYNNVMVDPQIHLTSYICNIKKILNN
jgi:DNA polymerase III delta prime subunit